MPEGSGIDLPLEGAVGYSMLEVTKVSKVPKVTKVKEFCLYYFYKKDRAACPAKPQAKKEATPQLYTF